MNQKNRKKTIFNEGGQGVAPHKAIPLALPLKMNLINEENTDLSNQYVVQPHLR